MNAIKEILMARDKMTDESADELIELAQNDLNERLASGEIPSDICEEWFGLEPDFVMDMI